MWTGGAWAAGTHGTGRNCPVQGAAVLCHRDQGCATGIGAMLALGSQLRVGVGIPARVWCWKLSWVPALGSQPGFGVGSSAGCRCWKPSWVSALGSQLGTGVGSPAGCQWCVSDQRLQRWRKKNPNSEPSILSQYLPIPKKLATLK